MLNKLQVKKTLNWSAFSRTGDSVHYLERYQRIVWLLFLKLKWNVILVSIQKSSFRIHDGHKFVHDIHELLLRVQLVICLS